MLSGGSLLFGSFCSSGPATGADASTIGEQRRDNHALTTDDENHFVAELIAGLGGYPAYYAHVGPANAAGSTAPDLTVPTSLSQPTRPRSTPWRTAMSENSPMVEDSSTKRAMAIRVLRSLRRQQ